MYRLVGRSTCGVIERTLSEVELEWEILLFWCLMGMLKREVWVVDLKEDAQNTSEWVYIDEIEHIVGIIRL